MRAQMKSELYKLGITYDQIPDWVAKLGPRLVAEAPPDAGLKPANAPIPAVEAKKTGAASMPASMDALPAGQVTGLQSAPPQSSTFDTVNKLEGPSGQHVESLGIDALHRLIKETASRRGMVATGKGGSS
jgi:hypothetical protein